MSALSSTGATGHLWHFNVNYSEMPFCGDAMRHVLSSHVAQPGTFPSSHPVLLDRPGLPRGHWRKRAQICTRGIKKQADVWKGGKDMISPLQVPLTSVCGVCV